MRARARRSALAMALAACAATAACAAALLAAPASAAADAPETTIEQGPSGWSRDNTPSFSFSASQGDASFQCSLDGDPFSACESPSHLGLALRGKPQLCRARRRRRQRHRPEPGNAGVQDRLDRARDDDHLRALRNDQQPAPRASASPRASLDRASGAVSTAPPTPPAARPRASPASVTAPTSSTPAPSTPPATSTSPPPSPASPSTRRRRS